MADFTTSIREILERNLNNIKTGIEQNMESKGRNASKKSVRSLKVVIRGEMEASIEADKSFNWMERGRKSGGIPPNFVEIIMQWMNDKGISPADPEDAAWAIAMSIKKRGTALSRGFRGHDGVGYDDIFTSKINEALVQLEKDISWFTELEVDRILQE